jgi:hypothetical protein
MTPCALEDRSSAIRRCIAGRVDREVLTAMHVLILKTKAPRSFENSVNYSPHDTVPYPTLLRVFGTTSTRTSTLHHAVMTVVTNISKKLLNSPAVETL